MPTYDYECTKCEHAFDAFQSMSDEPLKKCPSCGRNSLRRLIGGGLGVIFKGSGFYVTDSKSSNPAVKSSGKSTDSPSTDTAASSASSGGASDAKTDSKGDTKSDGGGKSDSGGKGDSGGKTSEKKSSEPAKAAG